MTESACKFNPMVDCPALGRTCSQCGWNPEVHQKRVNRLRVAVVKRDWINTILAKAGVKGVGR